MEDSSLSKEQRALKESIEGGAAFTSVVCGLIAALVVWLLTRNDYPILTYVFVSLTILATYWVASTVYTAIKTEDAKCKACGAAFSVAHVGREESLVAATPKKQEHAHGYVDGGKDDGQGTGCETHALSLSEFAGNRLGGGSGYAVVPVRSRAST